MFKEHPEGVVSVRFKTAEGAAACVERMNGRFFSGRQLVAHMWDGLVNYAAAKVGGAPYTDLGSLLGSSHMIDLNRMVVGCLSFPSLLSFLHLCLEWIHCCPCMRTALMICVFGGLVS